ncbi:hypothetical protein Val02_76740 [Virgisporangium aliadipatigenens]|uniref:Uncharacterized protein n=1 Tax=Virgisporangium aliadipatigenens TaxID=741659 RepID=A0A8J4DV51_9ACTN|nr:hypothetical protein [Virgisporangium aliadipatigenens]GIJ50788.1 hypothetical protein Val02_76740 [Virgisporangium aliadipatigenens]
MTHNAESPAADTVDERGVVITAEGRARVRRQLAELDAHWTPEERDRARTEFLARFDAA